MFIVKIDNKFVSKSAASSRARNIGSAPSPEGEVRYRVLAWTVNPLDAEKYDNLELARDAAKRFSWTYPSRVELMLFELDELEF